MARLKEGQIIDRYRVVRLLGTGGMSEVYEVQNTHTTRYHALKIPSETAEANAQLRQRFKREQTVSGIVTHPNLITVTDAGVARELGDIPFMVMDLLQGNDLNTILSTRLRQKAGPLPPQDVVKYIGQAAQGLDAAHAKGIVHRDLKPANLFVHQGDGAQVVKVIDFGIAKIPVEQGPDPKVEATELGSFLGTYAFASREQFLGSAISRASDIWSIGIIVQRLLTGEPYWTGGVEEQKEQILTYKLSRPSERWPKLPHSFDEWFFRSCARDPADRFKSVGDQAEALASVFEVTIAPGEGAGRASEETVKPVAGATRSRLGPHLAPRTVAWTVASVAAAMAIVTVAVGLKLRREPPRDGGPDPAEIGPDPACPTTTQRCDGVIPQTCSHGQWTSGRVSAGVCGAACTPQDSQCKGATPQTCSQEGQWIDHSVAEGACGAACTPETSRPRCEGKVPQSCTVAGEWLPGTACATWQTCRDGVCLNLAPAPSDAGAPKKDCNPTNWFYYNDAGYKVPRPECAKWVQGQ